MTKQGLSFFILLSIFSIYAKAQTVTNETDTIAHYMQNYQYQKALVYIETKIPTKTLLIQKARCYKSIGNCRQSIAILQPLSEQYPADISIKSELASCYQQTGNWQASINCYNSLIEIDPANIYFRIQKANMLYNQEKYNEALQSYKNIPGGDNNTSILKRIAECFEKTNMTDSARVYYKMAWDTDIYDGSAAANFINTSLKLKDFVSAMNAGAQYIEMDSTNKQVNRLYALTYYIMDLYEPACILFEKCINQGDSSLIVNRSLGISYYSLKDSRSYEYLKKAYAQDTTNNNVLYCLATVCNDLSKEEEAIPYFKTLLERIIPKNGTLYLNYRGLAISYDNLHRYNEALDSYKEAMKYGSTSQKAYILAIIAGIYNNNIKDRKMALKYYKEYRSVLSLYLEEMKAKEKTDASDIKEVVVKLKELEKHIKELEK